MNIDEGGGGNELATPADPDSQEDMEAYSPDHASGERWHNCSSMLLRINAKHMLVRAPAEDPTSETSVLGFLALTSTRSVPAGDGVGGKE